jgi:hypothetical protein
VLTLMTGWDYLVAGLRHVATPPQPTVAAGSKEAAQRRVG